ncbi:hypothetical protein GCM10010326_69160 [Streptomyces xanthochromogenes]|uniref:Uncharacterized protein n=1 Tax=Streptomyces xanthochromogenes TaxID=67384 RepID=A0ABQ3AQE4_9ACTN|nr:hypothetical protein GCM10010326_69160 [Streptomyces xanthochromogenes]
MDWADGAATAVAAEAAVTVRAVTTAVAMCRSAAACMTDSLGSLGGSQGRKMQGVTGGNGTASYQEVSLLDRDRTELCGAKPEAPAGSRWPDRTNNDGSRGGVNRADVPSESRRRSGSRPPSVETSREAGGPPCAREEGNVCVRPCRLVLSARAGRTQATVGRTQATVSPCDGTHSRTGPPLSLVPAARNTGMRPPTWDRPAAEPLPR